MKRCLSSAVVRVGGLCVAAALVASSCRHPGGAGGKAAPEVFPEAEEVLLWSADDSAGAGMPEGTACGAAFVRGREGPDLQISYTCDDAYPKLLFSEGRGLTRTDWSGFPVLRFIVSNPGREPLQLSCRVDALVDGKGTHRQGSCVLEPKSGPTEVFLDLLHLRIPDMKGQPRRGVVTSRGHWFSFKWSPAMTFGEVQSYQLYLAKPEKPVKVLLHRVDLLKGEGLVDMRPFVDRFGQYTDLTWEEKLTDEAQFPARIREEDADLAAHPSPVEWDRFGGWRNGPRLKATGRFRVAKHDGRWWFVTPEGTLFWSNGMDCVRATGVTFLDGRERWFRWLPEAGSSDPLATFRRPFWKRDSYDFTRANLFRKYGENWENVFRERSMVRLTSWGFNTLGNWSDPAVWEMRRLPYTIPIHAKYPPSPIRVAVSRHHSSPFPDCFHPEFAQCLRNKLETVRKYADDPWLLGVFIGNELPWGTWASADDYVLPLSIVQDAKDSYTRKAVLGFLRDKYPQIGDLNRTWRTGIGSWDALKANGCSLDDAQKEAAKGDMKALTTLIAERYYSICRSAMDDVMPGCLYLGSRFNVFTPEAVKAAAENCHVVSFNIYSETPSVWKLPALQLAAEMDFPLVSSEYHFVAKDTGLLGQRPVAVTSQQDRVDGISAYLADAVTHPNCVGAHWFQYLDQPVTARPIGQENFNTGFLTVTDTPYRLLRAAARGVGHHLYGLRAGTRTRSGTVGNGR